MRDFAQAIVFACVCAVASVAILAVIGAALIEGVLLHGWLLGWI